MGFRFFAEGVATRLGVGGYARNLFDGRVEVYAIGSAKQMEQLRTALRQGPRMAAVDGVEEHEAEVVGKYENLFSIERDD